MRRKLTYTYQQNDVKWMTEEDLEKLKEDGRYWAAAIFDIIEFMAKTFAVTLGSLVNHELCSCDLLEPRQVCVVLDTCATCLERLTPDIFY